MRFQDGIQAQRDVLAQSAAGVRASLAGVAPLPQGSLISLIGIGASEHAAFSAAAAWRALGIRAIAQSASDFLTDPLPVADIHVALSESGRSAETITALHAISGRVVTVTNGDDSPLANATPEVILLKSGPDSPVYTTGYTATLQALGLLGEHWSGIHTDWSSLPAQAQGVIVDTERILSALGDAFDAVDLIDVIGTGSSVASAGEGALMLREGARAHTAAHETQNYLHGPMEPLDGTVACIVIGSAREVQLAQDIAAIGSPTLLITTRTDVEATHRLKVLQLPQTSSPMARAVLEIVPIQLLVRELAGRRGLAVDGFRYRQADTKIGQTLALASDAKV